MFERRKPVSVAPIDKENATPNNTSSILDSILFKTSPKKPHAFPMPRRKQSELTPVKTGLTPNEKRTRAPSIGSGTSINRFLVMPTKETQHALSPQQRTILDVCLSGTNVFFSGGAGTGKSALLSHMIPALHEKHSKEEVFVTATTGLAAYAIGGITVHQFAGMRPNDSDSAEMVRMLITYVMCAYPFSR